MLGIENSSKQKRGENRWKKKRKQLEEKVGLNDSEEDDANDGKIEKDEENEPIAQSLPSVESLKSVGKFLDKLSPPKLATTTRYPSQPSFVSEYASFTCNTKHNPLYLLAKYNKFQRDLSQTRWFKGSSVEEEIVRPLLPCFGSKEFKFSTAGREDADVRMLGNGRHFVVQFIDPHMFPSVSSEELVQKVSQSSKGTVEISDVSVSENDSALEVLKEGEEAKRKHYRAVIWVENPCDDYEKNIPTTPFQVNQETPIRVSHRRSLLERPKTVYNLKFEKISTHFFLMDIDTGAGMYIKEFVHGDRGRTNPSASNIFGCNADILQLDVLGISRD